MAEGLQPSKEIIHYPGMVCGQDTAVWEFEVAVRPRVVVAFVRSS